ncbi:hypothetical protein [Streptomyces sp. M-16]|uniref:hypothetical protein n=1 Tax=Streptomyces sp. M-16 TaxID=3233040 RepID=UPI003F9BEBF1
MPAATRGFDGGKTVNGRKRHIVVDALGLLLHQRRSGRRIPPARALRQSPDRRRASQGPKACRPHRHAAATAAPRA